MKTYIVEKINNEEIKVTTKQQLEELYNTITIDEENFIISNGKEARLIIASDLVSKVKEGKVILTAGTFKEEK